MSLSKKEQDEIQPIIHETVAKRLGFPENAVIKAAMQCLVDDLDHESASRNMSSLLGDDLAPRFVEDLLNNVQKFRRDKLLNRKRQAPVAETEEAHLKKSKLNRLNALIDDEPLPPTVPEVTPDADTLLGNASSITEMVATMKKQIEQRKKMLISSGVAPALIEQQERLDQRTKQQEEKNRLLDVADDKAKRAAELQARIQAKMSGKLSLLKGLPIKNPSEMNAIPITEMTKPAAVVLDDEGNAIDQATGRIITISQRMPSLKINIREKKKEQLKNDAQLPEVELEDQKHFDPRVGMSQSQRGKRSFAFHCAGKFQQLAQRMRAKAQMEKLQKQIQAVAKKTGISSAAKLAQVAEAEDLKQKYVPDIEWWDMALLPNHTYKDLERTLKENEERILGITNFIEHPVAKDAPSQIKTTPAMPIFLTKKERKKIRTQRRRENEKEKQEKIRLGLEPPPPPKVKISNLMRVLASEAVQDPTKVEAHVRAQMAARQKKHEAANEERKLSKEERTDKKIKKLKEDTSLGVHTAVYRVLNLSNPKKKFKVDTNATQLYLTGAVVMMKEMVLVIVEGGPKAQRRFKHLMLHRIKWEEDSAQGRRQDKIDRKNNEVDQKKKMNACQLIWEGTNITRNFTDWKFNMFKTEQETREFLKKANVEHYWNLAHSQAVLEEADT